MRSNLGRAGASAMPDATKTATWIALVGSSSVLFSFIFACAMPFAALATIAGTRLPRRDGLMLVGVAWLANQAIGYLLLGYPRSWDSYAWGLAIGAAALLATVGAGRMVQFPISRAVRLGAALTAAFAIYEGALLAATAVLPASDGAFSLVIVGRLFAINAVALAGLCALHRAAVAVGLISRIPAGRPVVAPA